jgi:hypothetical protein
VEISRCVLIDILLVIKRGTDSDGLLLAEVGGEIVVAGLRIEEVNLGPGGNSMVVFVCDLNAVIKAEVELGVERVTE